ncbi:MAG: response regulator, partial [Longimicrobiales bacterium]
DLVAESDRERLMDAFQQVRDGTPLEGFVSEFVHRSGHPVICSINANPSLQDGEFVTVRSIMRDVTEQTTAEQELAASRANLIALVENTGDAIWSVDTNHSLITFNSAFALEIEARSGREPNVGDVPEDLLSADHVEWYHEAYDLALMGNRVSRVREERVDGNLRHYEFFFNPIRDERGMAGVAVFSKDVTWRKEAENELVAATVQAEEANRAKSQFLANMSHELRTPLNSVIGFANILIKNKSGNLVERELGFLERIQVNGKHLLTLINEILDLSKIEAGKIELESHPVDLGTVAHEAMSLVDGQIRQKEGMVTVRAEIPEDLALMEGDSAKLKQVLVNLIGNALKFTEEGEIVIQVRTLTGNDDPAMISVRDTGIGISPERLDGIFEAFKQAEAGTARTYGGTGLGLTISRALCLLMGYDLTVESEVAKGTTFTIQLHPGEDVELDATDSMISEEAVSEGDAVPDRLEPAAAPLVPGEGGKRRHVLVIDDDPDSRALLTHYLEGFGCRVSQAASASEGISKARQDHPDLLTLDLIMPELDGWDTLQILKQDPNLRDIPVVVTSVVAGEERGRLLGAADLLNKPFERDDLLRLLWRHLGGQRSRRVLVVDDDLDFQRRLGEYVAGDGVNIQYAANGEEAFRMVEKEAPDAILLDLMMPLMDGMTFLRKLREGPYYKGLPVIVMTSGEPTPNERIALSEHASAVLKKGEGLEEGLREVMGVIFPARVIPEAARSD